MFISPIAIASIATAALAPNVDIPADMTYTAPTHELAMITCLSVPDNDYDNCVKAVNNTDWAPASTVFVARQMTFPAIREYVDSQNPQSHFDRDVLICELSFPTYYDADDDMYLTDPNAFALEACIDDTISNHGMTDDM